MIKIDGVWFIHNDSTPAITLKNNDNMYYLFYHMGHNFKIEDLPWSGEVKTFLRLKHEEFNHEFSSDMLWYK